MSRGSRCNGSGVPARNQASAQEFWKPIRAHAGT